MTSKEEVGSLSFLATTQSLLKGTQASLAPQFPPDIGKSYEMGSQSLHLVISIRGEANTTARH